MSEWRHRAACRDEDPALFFTIGDSKMSPQQAEDAKSICRRCPVEEACLAWSLETNQPCGVWGAMTADERRALKRRAARAAARTRAGSEASVRAMDLFRTVRPDYGSDRDACKAVAALLGISRIETVREWAIDAELIVPSALAAANEQRRRAAVSRFEQVRDDFPSANAAHVALAAEFGVNPDTVRVWVAAAARKSRVLVTTNEIKEN